MKGKLFLAMLLSQAILTTAFCQKEKVSVKMLPDSVAADSTEYELIVFDLGFETWYMMQPPEQHSLEYFRSKNRLYVIEWNNRFMFPVRYGNIYDSYIDYDPMADYGLEVERRLYYYFKYFEEINKVDLAPGMR